MTKAKTEVTEALHKGDPRWPVYFTRRELLKLRKEARAQLVHNALYSSEYARRMSVEPRYLVKIETIDAELARRPAGPHWSTRVWWLCAVGTPSVGAIVCVVLWVAGAVR